jgi:hypothetical protein
MDDPNKDSYGEHFRVPLTLRDWLSERLANCLTHANEKTGSDRNGWLEDAQYFRQALDATDCLAAERQKVAELEHTLKELLAVIHRDGGHYTAEHGIEKSAKDATQLSCQRLDAEAELARLRVAHEKLALSESRLVQCEIELRNQICSLEAQLAEERAIAVVPASLQPSPSSLPAISDLERSISGEYQLNFPPVTRPLPGKP